jgi:sphingolipid delta-4 desaturase
MSATLETLPAPSRVTGTPGDGQPLDRPGEGAYVLVEGPQPHPQRARTIVADHPEVTRLFGVNRWSGAAVVGIVGFQLLAAWWLTQHPFWLTLVAACSIGAFLNHALWVLVHEATHNLIFRRVWLNRVMALVANLPMVFPATVSFAIFHIKHHRYLGVEHHDADLAQRFEAWLLRGGFFRRLLWQCVFPVTQSLRTLFINPRGKPRSWTSWLWPNVLVQIAFDAALFLVLGYEAFYYLALSFFFSIGPHPLGARWIQEHYVFRKGQETYSYYGPANLVAFNIGYHNEHHDLPSIPWSRLPKLKRLAAEMYDGLYAHYSWTKLWLRFLFDRKLKVERIARQSGGPPAGLERYGWGE